MQHNTQRAPVSLFQLLNVFPWFTVIRTVDICASVHARAFARMTHAATCSPLFLPLIVALWICFSAIKSAMQYCACFRMWLHHRIQTALAEVPWSSRAHA